MRSTLRALDALRLLSPEDAASLLEGYEVLSRIENRLRIETDQAAWALPTAPAALLPIARRMGYHGTRAAEHLLADVRRRREAIRAAFESCFAREQRRHN